MNKRNRIVFTSKRGGEDKRTGSGNEVTPRGETGADTGGQNSGQTGSTAPKPTEARARVRAARSAGASGASRH